MRSIDRKLLRDFIQMAGQALAICLVIASGVATCVMSLCTLVSMEQTKQTYYDRYRFADVFAHVKRAPNALAARIAEIPGVARVQTRVVVDVTIDVEGLREPAIGRLISIADHPKTSAGLNKLHLRSGRYIEPEHPGEVIINEAFADTHKLKPGDSIGAVINQRWQQLRIVGVALSPEYVLQIPSGAGLPDVERFGVFWIGYKQIATAYDMDGAFNDVCLTLMRGASEKEVIARLDDLTEPYGGVGSHGRFDQVSHRYLTDEIRGLRGMGLISPLIFLSVAGFLLNVVLSRLISTQREQIAILKAFGYTNIDIAMHYIKLVALITVTGVVLGMAVGVWLGRGLTELYTEFYRFPMFAFEFDWRVALLAFGFSIAAALSGTIGSVLRAVNLPPAEAMRPQPPAAYRPTLIERMGLQRAFSQTARMVMRNLERHPLKAAMSTLGIAFGVSVLVLGNYMNDALDYMIEYQFWASEKQDVMISFVEPTSAGSIHDVDHLPGVMYSEPFRAVPVRLRNGHRSRRVGIMGLPMDSRMRHLIDDNWQRVSLPQQGVMMSAMLAKLLGVVPGDVITVEVQEGSRPVRQVAVTGVIDDYMGEGVFMNINALHRLMREGPQVSGALMLVDDRYEDDLYTLLKGTPRVAAVTVKTATLDSFNETVAENQLMMQMFNVIFACIIAFGVIYNTARISLSERSRELATLRVIGFTRWEISAVLLGELAVLTFLALPVGMLIGYGFAWLMVLSFDSELYRFPLVISQWNLAFATAVTLGAALISGLIVRRRLDRLNLVSVLKAAE